MKSLITAVPRPIVPTIAPGYERSGPGMSGTFRTFMAGIGRISPKSGGRMLDIGCGSGFFTRPLGQGFKEVHGVDINPESIAEFNELAPPRFTGHLLHSTELPFRAGYFDRILSIETLEHVADLAAVAQEAARVTRIGGDLILTVPNRWYPIEGHGGTMFGREFYRIPFINWFPALHNRIAKARVFTVRDLDQLFQPLGFSRRAVGYLWPTFEHGGGGSRIHAPIQKAARILFPLMRWMETGPLRCFGSSVIVRYERVSGQRPV